MFALGRPFESGLHAAGICGMGVGGDLTQVADRQLAFTHRASKQKCVATEKGPRCLPTYRAGY
jgi:hypothetical protein